MVQWAKNYVWGAKFNFLRPKLSINLKYIYIIIIFFKPWGALGQYMAPSLVPFSILPGVKVCLVEWILQQQQQQQQQQKRRVSFLECVWLEGRGGKMMVGPGYFLPGPTKKFSPQNEEKTWWEEIWWLYDKNAHVQLALGLQYVAFFFFFFFSILVLKSVCFLL